VVTERYPSATQAVPRGPRPWRRWVALGAVALAVVTGRVLHDSWSSLRAGQQAEAAGQRSAAIRQYLRAARMYVPGSPFVVRALDQLQGLAASAAGTGDLQGEREALEAVRSALLGARSLYTPHADRLERASARLAAIYAGAEVLADGRGSLAAREQWHRQRLQVRPGPAVGATLAALLGLALWLGAVVVFIRRGVDRTLRLERRWALAAGIGFFVGFVLFVVGLRLA
jgi:hypothetical protein